MEKADRKKSIARLAFELAEETVIFLLLEVKLAAVEIKRKIHGAEKGVVMLALGGCLLLFALTTLIATAIAALALILPLWLAALAVTLVLAFFGVAFLFTGLGLLKDFSLVPKETLHRAEVIYKKIKQDHHSSDQESGAPETASREPAAESAQQQASELK